MSFPELEISSAVVGHLPVIRACLDKLGVLDVVDRHLPKHPLAHASDAECLAVMVLNILSGRVALWRMDSRFANTDFELLLGEGAESSWFHDTRLGQSLDRFDAVGTDTLLGETVVGFLGAQLEQPFSAHLDQTTAKLYGVYDGHVGGPTPAHGFSKDHRPDLKQLVFGMCLHGSCGVPLTMGLHDGNTADSVANRGHLSKLGALLPDPDQVTVVADCKLVDGETLGLLTGSGFHFVSLVPKTFNVRGELIDEVWSLAPDVACWPILATKPGAKKADPVRHYRGMSRTGAFKVAFPAPSPGGSPVESIEEFRCLVVHSEDLDARFDRSIDGKLGREADKLRKTHKRLLAREYACAADAAKAVGPLVKKLKWHAAHVTVEERQVVEKRAKRGRPRKDAPPPETRTVYVPQVELVRDDQAVADARRRASCFVLITDWSSDEWDDERVLSEYRYQSLIEGHTGFRWLKGPAAVAPVFLDTPSRIRALGFVFMVALMVRNYVQFTLRAAMKERGRGILHPFRKKADDNLTTEMALVWFEGVIATSVRQPGGSWVRQPPKLPEPALEVLELLAISVDVFRVPPRRTENGRAGP